MREKKIFSNFILETIPKYKVQADIPSVYRDGLPDKISIVSNTFKRNEEATRSESKKMSTLKFPSTAPIIN